jgi:hypothetical protein
LIWGAQLVQGTSAGDYKATYAAAAAVGYTDIYGQPFAQKLVETTANAQHAVFAAQTLTAAPYTLSVYAKQSGSPQRWLTLFPQGTGVSATAIFDVNSGSVTSTGGAQYLGASVTPVGNDWYRCSITFTAAAVSIVNVVYLSNSSSLPAPVYTGDGTSGIYIFGAQLSDSASVDPYVYQPVAAPTSTAYYGPRFDYDPVTLAPKGLLIEEQRTNLVLYSEQFNDAYWSKTDATVTANSTAAPTGNLTADTLVENTATSVHTIRSSNVSVTANTFYTLSFYAKAAGRTSMQVNFTNVTLSGNVWDVNLTANTIVLSSAGSGWSNVAGSITDVGNGWRRITISGQVGATISAVAVEIRLSSVLPTIIYTGDGTSGISLWGAQLEAGTFATSYIPTVASQVTRAADNASMIGNNFARWYTQGVGTYYVEATAQLKAGFVPSFVNDQNITIGIAGGTGDARVYRSSNLSLLAGNGSVVYPAYSKIAVGFQAGSNNSAISTGGATPAVFTSPEVTAISLGIGLNITSVGFGGSSINGTIKRIAYYPRRLANTELQGITS